MSGGSRGPSLRLQAIPVLFTRNAVSGTPARLTFPTGGSNSHVVGIVARMKALVAGFTGKHSPLDVLLASGGLQVFRVDAVTYAAQVIKVDVPRNGAIRADIEGPMGKLGAINDPGQLSVPVVISRTIPEPTLGVLIHRVAAPVVNKRAGRRTVASEPRIVLSAHSALQSSWNAFLASHRTSIHGFNLIPSGSPAW